MCLASPCQLSLGPCSRRLQNSGLAFILGVFLPWIHWWTLRCFYYPKLEISQANCWPNTLPFQSLEHTFSMTLPVSLSQPPTSKTIYQPLSLHYCNLSINSFKPHSLRITCYLHSTLLPTPDFTDPTTVSPSLNTLHALTFLLTQLRSPWPPVNHTFLHSPSAPLPPTLARLMWQNSNLHLCSWIWVQKKKKKKTDADLFPL